VAFIHESTFQSHLRIRPLSTLDGSASRSPRRAYCLDATGGSSLPWATLQTQYFSQRLITTRGRSVYFGDCVCGGMLALVLCWFRYQKFSLGDSDFSCRCCYRSLSSPLGSSSHPISQTTLHHCSMPWSIIRQTVFAFTMMAFSFSQYQ
jgi:hypothetical protein